MRDVEAATANVVDGWLDGERGFKEKLLLV